MISEYAYAYSIQLYDIMIDPIHVVMEHRQIIYLSLIMKKLCVHARCQPEAPKGYVF